MRKPKIIKHAAVLAAAFLFCTASLAVHAENYTHDENNQSAVQPDDTGMNTRDRDAGEVTADQQRDDESDRDITQSIRKAIVEDSSLSTYAHNIKIITRNGTVTLKGPVRSSAEKKSILDKTRAVVSADKVVDHISIKRKAKGASYHGK